MLSNQAHLERAVEAVLATKRKKIGILGLSFKPGTDDLRESPSVQLIKRLLGEGRQIKIWDRDVSLGRLVGSNRQFIAEEIPHIGALLTTDIEEVVKGSEVVVIGTKPTEEIEEILTALGPDQVIIDLGFRPGRSVNTDARNDKTASAEESSFQTGRGHLEVAVS